MDAIQLERSKNHIKKMLSMRLPMSLQFEQTATAWQSTLPASDGEWEPPLADHSLLGLPPVRRSARDSGSEGADPEETKMLAAALDKSRPRATGTCSCLLYTSPSPRDAHES
eukprot:5081888-Prymnesium_polylepis.1